MKFRIFMTNKESTKLMTLFKIKGLKLNCIYDYFLNNFYRALKKSL